VRVDSQEPVGGQEHLAPAISRFERINTNLLPYNDIAISNYHPTDSGSCAVLSFQSSASMGKSLDKAPPESNGPPRVLLAFPLYAAS
jgi:hypothetical protein